MEQIATKVREKASICHEQIESVSEWFQNPGNSSMKRSFNHKEAETKYCLEELDAQAKALFTKKEYKSALQSFKSLKAKTSGFNFKAQANIVLCYLKLKKFVKVEKSSNVFFNAINDDALLFQENRTLIVKTLYRRSLARYNLGLLKLAMKDIILVNTITSTSETKMLESRIATLRKKAIKNCPKQKVFVTEFIT